MFSNTAANDPINALVFLFDLERQTISGISDNQVFGQDILKTISDSMRSKTSQIFKLSDKIIIIYKDKDMGTITTNESGCITRYRFENGVTPALG